MDVKFRCMSFLDSSHAYSAADYPRQKMLLWKFCRMAWAAHANANAPAPSWIVNPARITSLHPRLTALTPVMVQALGKQKDVIVDSIIATVDDCIVAKRKRRGVCPWSAGDQFSVPSCLFYSNINRWIDKFIHCSNIIQIQTSISTSLYLDSRHCF